MPLQFHVHLLPRLVDADRMRGHVAVVIDVLRATTTITAALQAGAETIIPCATVDEAFALKSSLAGDVLLGGERGGLKVEGFDAGNSPHEYDSARVTGKTLVFTTTNGTQAMAHCRQADRVLLAAFSNLSAVSDTLRSFKVVQVVCSGTNGAITREDTLLAGCLAVRLGAGDDGIELNDEARIARDAWLAVAHVDEPAAWVAEVADSQGGRNLTRLGQTDDIETAAQIDTTDLIPELDVATWRILRMRR